jgi:hypothetical protein
MVSLEYDYSQYIHHFFFHDICWLTESMGILLQFTDHGIEGVVPLELLPPDVRSKHQAKPNDRSKRAKKDEPKGASHQVEDNQVSVLT